MDRSRRYQPSAETTAVSTIGANEVNETVELLAQRAPTLREATRQGMA